MEIQSTALTTIIGAIIMFGASYIIHRRLQQSSVAALRPIQLFQRFFLAFGLFFLIMWLPNLTLGPNPAAFPVAQAWGYIVGHIFLYLAFITTGLMMCTIVPRLAGKERWVAGLGAVLAAAITIANTATMLFGTLPSYNYERSLVQYNAAPVVGAGIGIFAMLTLLPAGILFLANAFRNPAQRIRSALLGVGFFVMTIAGPLHDVATTWQMYSVADIATIIGMVITGIGVVYRLDQSLALNRPAPAPVTAGQPS
ncbi:MAG TPA: hypothetical protein VI322_05155 [Candidatus Saccharimonadia bacterium]